jgi:phosphoglycolate phosphatase-like HAD superfamily hydrolase
MEGLIFLDFDGVICDSLLETLVSSWRGYYLLRGEAEPAAMPVSLRRDFARLRPYVRAGEDFILIHELIAAKTRIHSQESFDAQAERRGAETIARYREAFYAARRDLLDSHRDYWVGLNHLYPHMSSGLARWVSYPSLYILSTKRADYIVEILTAKAIDMDPQRVLSCGAREKKNTILGVLERRQAERALFIDDQIDHLASDWARDPRIVGCLAAWGYVQQQWLKDPRGIEVLQPHQLDGRLRSWLEGSTAGG